MVKGIAWFFMMFLVIGTFSLIVRACNDTADVAHKEFSASALLAKYENFKDLAAAIDKKRADIDVYQQELSTMTVEDKDDKFYYQQRKSEVLGLVSIYNGLVSEYNSAMSKANYSFTNIGQMPQSNMTPLPREYQNYILNLNQK